mmetsp:Transcript_25466/g.39092  ORF Transcript_25466/g.39092 Transcript_25466/m.39092 type:complete len:144 (+) Transcript_25466:1-432(+)
MVVFFAAFASLTNVTKTVAHKVVEGGGIVRSIQNHGIRVLPHRFKARYPDMEGNRYYEKGRYFSIYYDANPRVLKQVENVLRMDEEILRTNHLQARNPLWYVNIAHEGRNPYIRKVKYLEKKEQEEEEERLKKEEEKKNSEAS